MQFRRGFLTSCLILTSLLGQSVFGADDEDLDVALQRAQKRHGEIAVELYNLKHKVEDRDGNITGKNGKIVRLSEQIGEARGEASEHGKRSGNFFTRLFSGKKRDAHAESQALKKFASIKSKENSELKKRKADLEKKEAGLHQDLLLLKRLKASCEHPPCKVARKELSPALRFLVTTSPARSTSNSTHIPITPSRSHDPNEAAKQCQQNYLQPRNKAAHSLLEMGYQFPLSDAEIEDHEDNIRDRDLQKVARLGASLNHAFVNPNPHISSMARAAKQATLFLEGDGIVPPNPTKAHQYKEYAICVHDAFAGAIRGLAQVSPQYRMFDCSLDLNPIGPSHARVQSLESLSEQLSDYDGNTSNRGNTSGAELARPFVGRLSADDIKKVDIAFETILNTVMDLMSADSEFANSMGHEPMMSLLVLVSDPNSSRPQALAALAHLLSAEGEPAFRATVDGFEPKNPNTRKAHAALSGAIAQIMPLLPGLIHHHARLTDSQLEHLRLGDPKKAVTKSHFASQSSYGDLSLLDEEVMDFSLFETSEKSSHRDSVELFDSQNSVTRSESPRVNQTTGKSSALGRKTSSGGLRDSIGSSFEYSNSNENSKESNRSSKTASSPLKSVDIQRLHMSPILSNEDSSSLSESPRVNQTTGKSSALGRKTSSGGLRVSLGSSFEHSDSSGTSSREKDRSSENSSSSRSPSTRSKKRSESHSTDNPSMATASIEATDVDEPDLLDQYIKDAGGTIAKKLNHEIKNFSHSGSPEEKKTFVEALHRFAKNPEPGLYRQIMGDRKFQTYLEELNQDWANQLLVEHQDFKNMEKRILREKNRQAVLTAQARRDQAIGLRDAPASGSSLNKFHISNPEDWNGSESDDSQDAALYNEAKPEKKRQSVRASPSQLRREQSSPPLSLPLSTHPVQEHGSSPGHSLSQASMLEEDLSESGHEDLENENQPLLHNAEKKKKGPLRQLVGKVKTQLTKAKRGLASIKNPPQTEPPPLIPRSIENPIIEVQANNWRLSWGDNKNALIFQNKVIEAVIDYAKRGSKSLKIEHNLSTNELFLIDDKEAPQIIQYICNHFFNPSNSIKTDSQVMNNKEFKNACSRLQPRTLEE